MPYEGEILNECGILNVDFSTTYVVAVSGDGPNVCGHLLLYTASRGGFYFHATGDPNAKGIKEMRGFPLYMSEEGYQRYLRETGKKELVRRKVDLPRANAAYLELERQLSEPWTWLVLPHNCVSFCEDIIEAGGGTWGSYSNCPRLATADTLEQRLQSTYRWLNSGVESLYGIPAH